MTKARDLANAADVLDDVSATELSYVNGVTSAIQTQLNAKQAVVSGVDDTEIGYLNGVTSAIQTQIDSKIGSASAISPTLIDAKGDLIVGSAADTAARLAVGTNDYVLTADSSATNGIKWAAAATGGGMTLISTTTLSNRQTDLTSIPGTYNNLVIMINGANFPTYNTQISIRPNGSTNIVTLDQRQNSGGSNNSNTATDSDINISAGYNISLGNSNNTYVCTIFNYANTSYYKPVTGFGYIEQSGGTGTAVGAWGGIETNSAITSITIYLGQNVSYNSGQVLLYGVK